MRTMMMTMTMTATTLVALAGCGGGPTLEQEVTATAAAPAVAAPTVAAVGLPGLRFEPPLGWVAQPTSSQARVAEYRLPGVGADDARLVIYYFGARGAGTLEANLERWYGQFEQPEGRASSEVATVEARDVNGLAVTTVDLSGVYVAETAPGSGERVHEPDSRMLAAVIGTEAGPYYVKLVGPVETVARWKTSYEGFLESLQPHSASGSETIGTEHP